MRQEVLTNEGKAIFPFLESFPKFYLAGGTGLALQIGHRISIDFDLFNQNNIQKDLLKKVETVFKKKHISVAINNSEELTVTIDTVKITFLKYPFHLLLPLETIGGIHILSTKEIASTKAYTIGRRGSYKDYVDIYYILKEQHTSLEEIIELADKKFGGEFNSRLFLEQLLFMDDIDDIELVFLKEKIDKKNIKDFFKNIIQNSSQKLFT